MEPLSNMKWHWGCSSITEHVFSMPKAPGFSPQHLNPSYKNLVKIHVDGSNLVCLMKEVTFPSDSSGTNHQTPFLSHISSFSPMEPQFTKAPTRTPLFPCPTYKHPWIITFLWYLGCFPGHILSLHSSWQAHSLCFYHMLSISQSLPLSLHLSISVFPFPPAHHVLNITRRGASGSTCCACSFFTMTREHSLLSCSRQKPWCLLLVKSLLKSTKKVSLLNLSDSPFSQGPLPPIWSRLSQVPVSRIVSPSRPFCPHYSGTIHALSLGFWSLYCSEV